MSRREIMLLDSSLPMELSLSAQALSMSLQVCGQEAEHLNVRKAVVQYMQSHPDLFSPFVEDDEGFEKYISRMNKVLRSFRRQHVTTSATCTFATNQMSDCSEHIVAYFSTQVSLM